MIPTIVSRQRSLVSKMAKIEATVANKEFQVSESLYGGVEDITDEIAGLALVLNASKVIYDGGKLDAQISADRLEAESARYELMAHVDARALEISELWIELEKYEALNGLISSRLK